MLNIHQYPELRFDCHETAAFVAENLRDFGVDEIHEGIARTGIVASIEGQGEGGRYRAGLERMVGDAAEGRLASRLSCEAKPRESRAAMVTGVGEAPFRVYFGDVQGSVDPSLSWLNPFEIESTSALVTGVLLAVFIYWGWDSAVTVNEESEDASKTPGKAAIISTLVLVGIYILVTIAAMSFGGLESLAHNLSNFLAINERVRFLRLAASLR